VARYTDSVCRICRREGQKLFLKGDRCYTDKCAYDRRPYSPGQHGQGTVKLSEYGIQLREKQKLKKMYGLLERQFRITFEKARRQKGVTGTNLLSILERRLDSVCYRLGFGNSRAEARQLVKHNHILVNGKRVNIPSYVCRAGDVVSVADKSRKSVRVEAALAAGKRRNVPDWLQLNADEFKGSIQTLPKREDIQETVDEQLVVELYSR
jgi:small subunit ribosomal protein S4